MKVNIGPYPDFDNQVREVDVSFQSYDFWSLDITLALVILPALELFEKYSNIDSDDYGKMLHAFREIVNEKHIPHPAPEIQEGLDLFAKYYTSLWI
jgi:hypothetical protein